MNERYLEILAKEIALSIAQDVRGLKDVKLDKNLQLTFDISKEDKELLYKKVDVEISRFVKRGIKKEIIEEGIAKKWK